MKSAGQSLPSFCGRKLCSQKRMRNVAMIMAALILIGGAGNAMATDSGNPEEAVCGSLREPLAFWLWSSTAGSPNPDAAAALPNAKTVEHTTRDGRVLKGYKLDSTAADGAVKGRLLVAQGNAMLADQLLEHLSGLTAEGFETYVFDYRGYGASEGRARLKAIVGDYQELASALEPRHFYGISFGGIVVMNGIAAGVEFHRAVIDSAPSRVSEFGCPERYDPVAKLPVDARGLLVIAGEQDEVVPANDVRELAEVAAARGGRAQIGEDFGHPLTDPAPVHRQRMELIRSFLAETD